MIVGRSILIWLILLLLGYNILGTLNNLSHALSGTINFGTLFWASGLTSVGLSTWLFIELWQDSPRQVVAAWSLFALMALIQVYAAAAYPFSPDPQLSSFEQHTAIYIFTAIMVAIYAIIPLYLTWRSKKAIRPTVK